MGGYFLLPAGSPFRVDVLKGHFSTEERVTQCSCLHILAALIVKPLHTHLCVGNRIYPTLGILQTDKLTNNLSPAHCHAYLINTWIKKCWQNPRNEYVQLMKGAKMKSLRFILYVASLDKSMMYRQWTSDLFMDRLLLESQILCGMKMRHLIHSCMIRLSFISLSFSQTTVGV